MAKIRYIFIKEKMMKKFLFSMACVSFLFGNDYDVGLDFYKNKQYQNAYEYFLKSANSGNSQAAHNLAIMYHNGDGVKKDTTESIKWLQIASDAKNPYAMTQLGNNYMNGLGVPKDYKKAIALFTEAALLDNPQAAYNLGYMYTIGMGVPINNETGASWYEKAA